MNERQHFCQHFEEGGTYRSDEPCSCFHGAEASVPDLQSQDLGTRGHTVALRFFWKVTGCNACHMCSMSSFKNQTIIIIRLDWVGDFNTWRLQHIIKLLTEDAKIAQGVSEMFDWVIWEAKMQWMVCSGIFYLH